METKPITFCFDATTKFEIKVVHGFGKRLIYCLTTNLPRVMAMNRNKYTKPNFRIFYTDHKQAFKSFDLYCPLRYV